MCFLGSGYSYAASDLIKIDKWNSLKEKPRDGRDLTDLGMFLKRYHGMMVLLFFMFVTVVIFLYLPNGR